MLAGQGANGIRESRAQLDSKLWSYWKLAGNRFWRLAVQGSNGDYEPIPWLYWKLAKTLPWRPAGQVLSV